VNLWIAPLRLTGRRHQQSYEPLSGHRLCHVGLRDRDSPTTGLGKIEYQTEFDRLAVTPSQGPICWTRCRTTYPTTRWSLRCPALGTATVPDVQVPAKPDKKAHDAPDVADRPQ
jgi:hypothetical protein